MVKQRADDIFVATENPRVGIGCAIQRGFVAQLPVDGVEIVLNRRIERVVAKLHRRHLSSYRCESNYTAV